MPTTEKVRGQFGEGGGKRVTGKVDEASSTFRGPWSASCHAPTPLAQPTVPKSTCTLR